MKYKEKELSFTGPFAELAENFICYKRSLGYAYKTEVVYMRHFCEEVALQPHPLLTKEIVTEWCAKRDTECPLTQRQRKRVLRQFGNYLEMMGQEAYIVPKASGKVTMSRYIPYIFTQNELHALFSAIDSMLAKSWAHGRSMHPLIFRIMYCCGLRISETLNLRCEDVNLQDGILTIRNSKFEKDRLVPMSASLNALCKNYAEIPRFTQSSYFFPAPDGGPYNSRTLYSYFRRMLKICNIPHMARGKGPRMHDFRHTFAVHCLNRWTREGRDIYSTLPILAAYLGHDSIYMTQKYLRLTPEIHPMIIATVENACKGVIPSTEDSL